MCDRARPSPPPPVPDEHHANGLQLPRRHGEARTEAVARLQGVVNAMLAGLSSTPRCERPTSSGVQSSQELDRLVSSGNRVIQLTLPAITAQLARVYI